MKRLKVALVAAIIGLAPLAAYSATVSTGVITSTANVSTCTCTVRCAAANCVILPAAQPGYCTLSGTITDGNSLTCAAQINVGAACNCAVNANPKQVRLVACFQDNYGDSPTCIAGY